jgi:acyl transferase domain-containing protein
VTLALSARTPAALDTLAQLVADHLDQHPEQPLADVAYTLAVGRVPQPYRREVTGSDRSRLSTRLRTESGTVRADGPAAPPPHLGRRVHLPGYPFERRRYWPPAPQSGPAGPAAGSSGWLAQVFADVLGRTPSSDEESFFDLGGDSLMAIQLISRVSAGTGIEPDLETFFDAPTVAGLAAQLSHGQGAPA